LKIGFDASETDPYGDPLRGAPLKSVLALTVGKGNMSRTGWGGDVCVSAPPGI
jgi:hypothetical protein